MSLNGKVALVTGAAQGLGRAFSEILLKNGAKVGLADFNVKEGEKTASELDSKYGKGNTVFVKCDITAKDDFQAALSKVKSGLGGIDIVINNAGVGIEGDGWEKTIDVNVNGTIRGTVAALNHLRKDKGGRGGVIVNVASMAGLNANPCAPVYGASKAAVIMFSRCWAMNPEIKANNVRINVLAPAFAETAMVKALQTGNDVHQPQIAAGMLSQIGILKVEAVAEALLELVADESKAGAVLTISEKTGKNYAKS